MNCRWLTSILAVPLALALIAAPATWVAGQELPAQTDLDRYVNKPDPSYSWKVVSATKSDGVHEVVLDMISQTWLTPDQVDRPQWQHWVVLNYPEKLSSNVGFLMIGGGSNRDKAPSGSEGRVKQIAQATGAVVVELKNVPNQPLIFHNDGRPRSEDDLIGYTWDQFLKTGDFSGPSRHGQVGGGHGCRHDIGLEEGGRQTVDKLWWRRFQAGLDDLVDRAVVREWSVSCPL